jgi:hypothetical protein
MGKICRSFYYFILKWCWIEDKKNKCAIPFALWPEQVRVLPHIILAMRLLILKARQLGLTWMVAAYVLWLAWTRPLQLIIVISVNEELSIEFLERVYFIMDRLPEHLKPTIATRNRQVLEIQHNDDLVSTIKSLPTTEMGAQSKTPTLLVLDETSRNRLVAEIYAASLPGIDAAGGRVIVISNSIKTAPGWPWTRGIYTDSMKGENVFERIFMDWRARPDRPEDFKALKLMDGMTTEDFSQHYPETEEEAISAIGGAYFSDALARHAGAQRKGIRGTIINHDDFWSFEENSAGLLEVWELPYNERDGYDGRPWLYRYAMGADVSEGLGETYSTAYVVDRLTDEIVARMRSNRVDAHHWAEMLFDLSQYYGNALICPERTGAGQTTVKRLRELNANLYLRVKADKLGKGEVTKIYGWEETRNSKQELAGDLRAWMKTCPLIPDAILIDECSTFILREDGSLGHEDGKFDDCVMGAGTALQASKFIPRSPEKVPEAPPLRREPRNLDETAALERAEIAREAEESWKRDQEAMEGLLSEWQEG